MKRQDNSSESENEDVPPEMLAMAKEIVLNSLPTKSKQKYTIV